MLDVKKSFDRSWEGRGEAHYNHWTSGRARNQIQFAFRHHWKTFQPYLANLPSRRVLEVGCGRGTMASYFADAGYSVTLVDSSNAVMKIARSIYYRNGHPANFLVADAFHLPLQRESFAVCVSIGLLEHFDDIRGLLREQLRVLQPGGVLLNYIVPERPDSVQRYFKFVNRCLSAFASAGRKFTNQLVIPAKEPLYRNGFKSEVYVAELKKLGACEVEAFGMYPLPMVSHSPSFPFTLLPRRLERLVVAAFSFVLFVRRLIMFGRNPWRCREEVGQAFLVVARKPFPEVVS